MKLENIGFYTLSDDRVKYSSSQSQMKRCEMIITEYCNFKCPYCRGLSDDIYGNRKIKQLSFDEIKKNIDYWCQGEALENIRFSGGEPTLHKDILKIVSYAKHKGIKKIAISTNGSNKLRLYRELIKEGVNDFSISLDACCAEIGDKMAGNKRGSWQLVIDNIKAVAKLCYVTVGVVFTPNNINQCLETIQFAHDLGVADIRIISSAQWNEKIIKLKELSKELLYAHPILKYRVSNLLNNRHVRGIKIEDSKRCGLILDDSVIAGNYFFPCVIYMREKGKPIGRIGNDMRKKQKDWYESHNSFNDPICKKNCLDVCVDYNNKFRDVNIGVINGKIH